MVAQEHHFGVLKVDFGYWRVTCYPGVKHAGYDLKEVLNHLERGDTMSLAVD
jgi:hypothetical protein